MKFRKIHLVWLALVAALFVRWPLPRFAAAMIEQKAFQDWVHRPSIGELSFRPAQGFCAKNVTVDGMPGMELDDVTVHLPFWKGFSLESIHVDAGTMRIVRDTDGKMNLPWASTSESSKGPHIEFEKLLVEWTDVPLGFSAALSGIEGSVDPGSRSGRFQGRIAGLSAIPSSAGSNRNTDTTSVLGAHFEGPWDLRYAWEDGVDSISAAVSAEDASRGILLHSRFHKDTSSIDGKIWLDSFVLPFGGIADRDLSTLRISSDRGHSSGLSGEVRFPPNRPGRREWEARLDGRGIPGPLLARFGRGAYLSGPFDFAYSRGASDAQSSFSLDAENGRVSGASVFQNLARRPGFEGFASPHYDRISLRGSIASDGPRLNSFYFSGQGLTINFRGQIGSRHIKGNMKCSFSQSLVAANPQLRDAAIFLNRENGRTVVEFTVSGPRADPVLDPILPPPPVLALRSVGRILRGGIAGIGRGLSDIGEALFE